jgi:hypothetical protein
MYIIQDRRADDGKGTDDVRLVSERTSCRHADSYSVDFDVCHRHQPLMSRLRRY